jgi:hypothetical protein
MMMFHKKIDLRINVKFLVKLKKTGTHMFSLLCEAYVEDTHQEFMCRNGTRDFQKEERMWKMINDLAIQ